MYDILENGVPAEEAPEEVEADFTSELVNTVAKIKRGRYGTCS